MTDEKAKQLLDESFANGRALREKGILQFDGDDAWDQFVKGMAAEIVAPKLAED